MPNATDHSLPQRIMFGLLVRKPRWGLSACARALLFVITTGSAFIIIHRVQPFLAVTNPLPTEIVVVEGWVPAVGLKASIGIIHAGGYRQVLTSGCIAHYEDSGSRQGVTYADWGAQRLAHYGLTDVPLTPVPAFEAQRDRTYIAALAIREWLEKNRPSVTAINLITFSAHARRSQLIFQKALGARIKVGIISVPDPDYDPDHWWHSSEGVREVLGESIAYLYARLFFWPPYQPSANKSV